MDSLLTHTKYRQLANVLRERLRSHPNGGKLPSVRSLMKRFQVSQHTVMSALQLLEKEEVITRRHGSGVYRSDTNRLPVIAFCRPKTHSLDLEFKENALMASCEARGWKLRVHRFRPEQADVFAEDIHADAFVLMPEMVTFNSPLLSRLIRNDIPRLALGRDTGGSHLDFATGDDDSILKELIKGLVERGHRRLAFLVSEPPFYEIQERAKTFHQICQLLDLDFHVVLDAKVEYGRDGITQSAKFLKNYLGSLPKKRLPFTALITCSNSGSIPALRVFHEAGFHAPTHYSLCCMSCDPNAQYAIPSITNASPHYTEMAESCLRILEKRLQGDKSPLLFERITYHANWRESTGNAPKL